MLSKEQRACAEIKIFRDSFWTRNLPTSLGFTFICLFVLAVPFSRYNIKHKENRENRAEQKHYFNAIFQYCALKTCSSNGEYLTGC